MDQRFQGTEFIFRGLVSSGRFQCLKNFTQVNEEKKMGKIFFAPLLCLSLLRA